MPSSEHKRKPSSSPPFNAHEFFLRHPIFALKAFRLAGEQHGLTRTAVAERVKYGLERGRLKLLARGLYAVVPPGLEADRFTPDRFLVASALADDAVLAYHSALEVLGFAHSVYRDVYYLTTRRRRALQLSDGRVRALLPPKELRRESGSGSRSGSPGRNGHSWIAWPLPATPVGLKRSWRARRRSPRST